MTDEPVAPATNAARGHDQGAGGAAPPADALAEAVAEAVGHLQTAALSMAAAVRAALDAAEQLAKDPSPLHALLSDAARPATSGQGLSPEPTSGQRPRVEQIAVTPQQGSGSADRASGVSRTSAEIDDEPPDGRDRE